MSKKEVRRENRRVATEWLKEYEMNIVCASCGESGSIDWHNENHPAKPNSRVSSLRTQGASIKRIEQELENCTPLCRSCHMKEDGRLKALLMNAPYKKGQSYVEPKPCCCCGKMYKPLRKQMCSSCYNHHSGLRLRKTKSCDGCCAE